MQEKPAPHKALLLLSVIDLVEQGVITDSCIPLSDILKKQFKHNSISYLGDSSTYDPKINYPYYHMRSEPFWELVSTTANPVPDISNYSTSNLRKNIAYAWIDPELQLLLRDSKARAELRAVLISNYIDSIDNMNKEHITHTSKDAIPMEMYLQGSLEQRKAMFRQYLESLNKAESTIKQYTQYHLICESVLEVIKRETGKNNLYEVVDLSQIGKIYKCCNELAENKSRNNVYSASVSNYKNFIVFLETDEAYRLYNNIETILLKESKYLEQIPFNMTTLIENIKQTGLLYEDNLIKRYVCSLMTKPFVILSGLAGSGKTQLALVFAHVMSENINQQLCVVPVGADWTNREPLLGYPNALKQGEYVQPECGALQIMMRALRNPGKPYFLVLDEMNLSYVERYFADFLSALESHQEIPLWEKPDECDSEIPAKVFIPKNLFIIGTINVDETTYMFSPKVLDRANVIEFKISDDEMEKFLKQDMDININVANCLCANMGLDFVKKSTNKCISSNELAQKTLVEFFKVLKKVNAEFGYRSATEIYRFIANAKNCAEGMTDEEILDAAIIQKLLPKLHGSRKKLEPALKALWGLCFDPSIKDTMQIAYENIDKAIYKESADKIFRMYESAYANGFTSFAEA